MSQSVHFMYKYNIKLTYYLSLMTRTFKAVAIRTALYE